MPVSSGFISYSNYSGSDYFAGRCWNCDKWGHRKQDCWHLDNDEDSDYDDDYYDDDDDDDACWTCGKYGHFSRDCWYNYSRR